MKKLPNSEFEIMKIIWKKEIPITSNVIMQALNDEKTWKAPTVISFMKRLVNKGFLKTEKNGKERIYFPLVTKEEYLKFETEEFMQQYHKNSFASFLNAFCLEKNLKEEQLNELLDWAKKRGK